MTASTQLTADLVDVVRKSLSFLVGETLTERLTQADEDEKNVRRLQARLDDTAAQLRSEQSYRRSAESKLEALTKRSTDLTARESALKDAENEFRLKAAEFKLDQTRQVRDFLKTALDKQLNSNSVVGTLLANTP